MVQNLQGGFARERHASGSPLAEADAVAVAFALKQKMPAVLADLEIRAGQVHPAAEVHGGKADGLLAAFGFKAARGC